VVAAPALATRSPTVKPRAGLWYADRCGGKLCLLQWAWWSFSFFSLSLQFKPCMPVFALCSLCAGSCHHATECSAYIPGKLLGAPDNQKHHCRSKCFSPRASRSGSCTRRPFDISHHVRWCRRCLVCIPPGNPWFAPVTTKDTQPRWRASSTQDPVSGSVSWLAACRRNLPGFAVMRASVLQLCPVGLSFRDISGSCRVDTSQV
jgi:hypothetical protein